MAVFVSQAEWVVADHKCVCVTSLRVCDKMNRWLQTTNGHVCVTSWMGGYRPLMAVFV